MIYSWIRLGYRFTIFSMLWYRATMWWSKSKKFRVAKYENVEEIPKAFKNGRNYRPDLIFGSHKSDHLTHPTELEERISKGESFGDCDDHAIYWCAALVKSGLAKKVWFAFYSMEHVETKKRQAHAVCVFYGNDEKFYWADYRNPRKIDEVKDFMHQSARNYNCAPIAAAIWVVEGLSKDDTPQFGKITRLLP